MIIPTEEKDIWSCLREQGVADLVLEVCDGSKEAVLHWLAWQLADIGQGPNRAVNAATEHQPFPIFFPEGTFFDLAEWAGSLLGFPVKLTLVPRRGKKLLFYSGNQFSFRLWLIIQGISPNSLLVEISELVIPYPLRGQGLGSKIITKLKETLKGLPVQRMVLVAQSAEAARFWKRHGFTSVRGDYLLKLTPMEEASLGFITQPGENH